MSKVDKIKEEIIRLRSKAEEVKVSADNHRCQLTLNIYGGMLNVLQPLEELLGIVPELGVPDAPEKDFSEMTTTEKLHKQYEGMTISDFFSSIGFK